MQRKIKTKHMVQIIVASVAAFATIVAALISAKNFGARQGEEQARKEYLAMNQTINLTINGQEMRLETFEVNDLVNELYGEYASLSSKYIELESANTFLSQRVDILESQVDNPTSKAPTPKETSPAPVFTAEPEMVPEMSINGPYQGRYCYVQFGRYMHGDNGEIEPILWRVLKCEENIALIISEKILLYERLSPGALRFRKWDVTELKQTLNTAFLRDAFSDSERNSLIVHDTGYIRLLSKTEAFDPLYFSGDTQRVAVETPYASASRTKSSEANKWWLEPLGVDESGAEPAIGSSGKLTFGYTGSSWLGIRPVCEVSLELYHQSLTGKGTYEDPYVLK